MRSRRCSNLLAFGLCVCMQGTASAQVAVAGSSATASAGRAAKASGGKRKKARVIAVDANAASVTYPGFQLLSAGASQIWLAVSRTVPVRVERNGNVMIFVLGGARVGTANNLNPLITTHFDTPLSSARVTPHEEGAKLTVWLRESVEPVHRIVPGPRGSMVLEVNFPKAKKKYHSLRPIEVQKPGASTAASAASRFDRTSASDY